MTWSHSLETNLSSTKSAQLLKAKIDILKNKIHLWDDFYKFTIVNRCTLLWKNIWCINDALNSPIIFCILVNKTIVLCASRNHNFININENMFTMCKRKCKYMYLNTQEYLWDNVSGLFFLIKGLYTKCHKSQKALIILVFWFKNIAT